MPYGNIEYPVAAGHFKPSWNTCHLLSVLGIRYNTKHQRIPQKQMQVHGVVHPPPHHNNLRGRLVFLLEYAGTWRATSCRTLIHFTHRSEGHWSWSFPLPIYNQNSLLSLLYSSHTIPYLDSISDPSRSDMLTFSLRQRAPFLTCAYGQCALCSPRARPLFHQ